MIKLTTGRKSKPKEPGHSVLCVGVGAKGDEAGDSPKPLMGRGASFCGKNFQHDCGSYCTVFVSGRFFFFLPSPFPSWL
jgi:hypothetical protein